MDNTLTHGRVGAASATDGTWQPQRLDKTAAAVIAQGHASNAETVSRGNAFFASQAVTGVAPGTALSTTPPLAIWNPPTSGKNLVIMKAYLGYVSGTLGAGSVVLAQSAQATVPSSGTEIVPVNALLGAARGVGRAFTGSTITTAGTIIRPSFTVGAFLATTALVVGLLKDDIDGEIIVPPGYLFIMQEVGAAGTSPVTVMAAMWEELNI
jgi:hypothetical protein